MPFLKIRRKESMKSFKLPLFLEVILKGFSQIMLQENNLTGLLFIIGLFIGSVPCALAGLLAVVSSSIIAKILKFPECHLSQGL